MASEAELAAHRAIEARRQAGTPCDGIELARRIDELGDISLIDVARHDAFREVYDALTPTGFRLMPFPDRTAITVAGHVLNIAAVVVDENVGQVVGAIERRFELEGGFVNHQLLRLEKPYRGSGLSLVLLNQSFSFYRAIGLRQVVVHAALETGRWQWARVGFELVVPAERQLIETWAALCLDALGEPILPTGFPISELALLGTAPGDRQVSFAELHDRIESTLSALLADPQLGPAWGVFAEIMEQRSRAESQNAWGWRDEERWRKLASANRLGYDEAVPAGKVIMLAGPDWHGTFDLQASAAQAVFDQEFQRQLTP